MSAPSASISGFFLDGFRVFRVFRGQPDGSIEKRMRWPDQDRSGVRSLPWRKKGGNSENSYPWSGSGLRSARAGLKLRLLSMRLLPFTALIVSAFSAFAARGASLPDFNREIRPILSDKCFRCHGPDEHERKGGQNGLRLDTQAGSTEDLGGGGFAIVPGKPEKSELLARVTTADDEEVMPPRDSGKKLTTGEVEMLRRWIAGGAHYAQHWSYEPPRRHPLPGLKDQSWSKGPIDHFVLAQLERAGLRPQPEADRPALARRVALDLTGLPPTLPELDEFLADVRPDAYERYVDRLLAKPAYGEHGARAWLDLARYADSKGYADDQTRSIWRYRDYVIDAFNRNVPFDQFTIEQLAGDLLPNPTQEQLFATGFHRNTMTNTEGGTDDEEFRSAAVIDRVNTTLAVWMGTSIACAQCHTHKYDPLTHHDYFKLYAIFNQSEDADRADEAPVFEFFTEAQQRIRHEADSEIAGLLRTMRATSATQAAAANQWAEIFPTRLAWNFAAPQMLKTASGAKASVDADGRVFVPPGEKKDTYTLDVPVEGGVKVSALRVEAIPQASLPAQGAGADENGNFVVTRVRVAVKPAEPVHRGRYVRVELPGKIRSLALAEVQVFSAGENIAARGIASQSSTMEAGEAARAIDGKTEGEVAKASVSITATSDNPWWEIDLQSMVPLERILLWGRTGQDPTLGGLRVVVLDESREPVWQQVQREAPRPSRAFNLGDPREFKLGRVSASFAEAEFDEALVAGDQEPKLPNVRRRSATKRGWGNAGAPRETHTLTIEPGEDIRLAPGERLIVTLEQQSEREGATLNHFRVGTTTDPHAAEHLAVPATVLAAVQLTDADRTQAQRDLLLDYYVREVALEWQKERQRLTTLQRTLDTMTVNTSPIMRELPPAKQRKTHVQLRGNWQALGDEVTAGVPAAFPPIEANLPVNRLTLAQWLLDEKNPLTARVQANRLWEAIFGIGLVRTTEEFGSQGEPPSHPELLDWLALEFVAMKWDTKRFLKMLVTSAAYRQSSRVTAEALALDPDNRWVSRGPRFRLDAEMVRDQALAVSGLLSAKTHGPSGRPFQPAFGLNAAFGSALDWTPSTGEDRLRRGLYTEWRRSSPYPSMVTFDAPSREVCTLRRNRSNTPLQALVTLNDPVYVEAAQSLARILVAQVGSTRDRVRDGFRRVVARLPSEAEAKPLLVLYENALATYQREPEQAAALIAQPGNPPPKSVSIPELAAWTTVANVLLNLDEALMKR